LELAKILYPLQASAAEVLTNGNKEPSEEFLDIDEPPDDEPKPDGPNNEPEPAGSRCKTDRKDWKWEKKTRSFKSRGKVSFPRADYTQFEKMAPADLFSLFFDEEILALIATKSCEYAMAKSGTLVTISADDIRVFLAILILSGYNKVPDYTLYWSNSEDTENGLIKAAMSREKFMLIKHCLHMGDNKDLEDDR